jgi:hypothetical protein
VRCQRIRVWSSFNQDVCFAKLFLNLFDILDATGIVRSVLCRRQSRPALMLGTIAIGIVDEPSLNDFNCWRKIQIGSVFEILVLAN